MRAIDDEAHAAHFWWVVNVKVITIIRYDLERHNNTISNSINLLLTMMIILAKAMMNGHAPLVTIESVAGD